MFARRGESRWIVAGALILCTAGAWSALWWMPAWVAFPALAGGAGLIAFGLWGRTSRGRRESQDRVVEQAWAVAGALGQERRGAGSVGGRAGAGRSAADATELAEALGRAREAVPAMIKASGEAAVLRRVIEAVAEPVVATDRAGRVVIANRAAERVLGVRLDGRSRRIDDVLAHAEVLALHAAALEGRPGSARLRLVTGDEARVFDTTAAPYAVNHERGPDEAAAGGENAGVSGGSRGWGVVLAFRDVTELATAVQARTDFVANASHELRTPLTALRAAYDTLRLALDDPRMRERALQLAGSNLDRLEEMTRDLLDLSRLESPDAQVRVARVDVRGLVEEAAAPFEAARAARRLGLSIEIEPGAREAETDPRLVQEILRNLIDNACRFAHEGTTVRVIAEAVDAGDVGRAAGLRGEAREGGGGAEPRGRATLRLRVIDRGIGIPLDQQARVFERFYQVDPARSGRRRGTGLGLSIVKHAARALGGSVDVESVWGHGTTMIVELPGAVVENATEG